jgi:TonB family protein
MHSPVDVTVLRSGVPDTVPGRALNVGERGMAAIIAAELIPGESVGIEMRLPARTDPLRTRALVRYQDKLRCGLEFIALLPEQRTAIRNWAGNAQLVENSTVGDDAPESRKNDSAARRGSKEIGKTNAAGRKVGSITRPISQNKKRRTAMWLLTAFAVAIAVAGFWWRWNRGWEKLESGLRDQVETPQVQVPAEAMEKLLIHRVEPVYPPEAREAKLEGVIAVNIVVGRDGSVVRLRALDGPEVLARAATDALRWWKFQPYLVNGRPAVVETTVAVEFKQ